MGVGDLRLEEGPVVCVSGVRPDCALLATSLAELLIVINEADEELKTSPAPWPAEARQPRAVWSYSCAAREVFAFCYVSGCQPGPGCTA